eukprot:g46212.t1
MFTKRDKVESLNYEERLDRLWLLTLEQRRLRGHLKDVYKIDGEYLLLQLRDEFDQGLHVVLDEEHSVHDVAALLKEFLRDMPDPLLPKELYSAFINTMKDTLGLPIAETGLLCNFQQMILVQASSAGLETSKTKLFFCCCGYFLLNATYFWSLPSLSGAMKQKDQLSILQLLIYLLPPCNCDTLLRLLELLSKVASHAHDTLGEDGQE